MKVTFVMDGGDNLSGGHRVIAMLANGLASMGHRVFLIARPKRPPSLRDKVRSLVREGSLPAGNGKRPSHFRSAGVPLQVLADWRPIRNEDLPDADIVLATWWETVEWVWGLAPSKGVKVHLMQDYEIWGGRVDEVDRSCAVPLPKIVDSPWLPEFLETKFHQKALALIPCGVSGTAFHAEPRGKQAIPTFGLTYTDVYNKGCDVSIQAYRLATESVPEIRLVASGSKRVAKHLPLPAGTRYETCVTDETLRALYSQCDAWLFGTRKEGFGLPILEAMACRTPVIGTPAGAAPELLRDGAGILVKTDDPADMARAIVRVCRLSDREWRAMSDASEMKAAAYTWEAAVEKFEAALQLALRDSRKASA